MRSLGLGRGRGVTLLEMLVTLVVVSLIAGVVSQALAQLARIERTLEGSQLDSLASAVRAEWVRSAIESLLPGEVGSAERLRGDARELQGLSADVPMLPAPGLAALHLRLQYQAATAVTQLQLVGAPPGNGREAAEPVVLLSWPGRDGRFRYLDASGAWLDTWQGAAADAPAVMPRAIALETGLPSLPLLLAVPRASAAALPTRRQLEAL